MSDYVKNILEKLPLTDTERTALIDIERLADDLNLISGQALNTDCAGAYFDIQNIIQRLNNLHMVLYRRPGLIQNQKDANELRAKRGRAHRHPNSVTPDGAA